MRRKNSQKHIAIRNRVHTALLLGLFLDPEDGSNIIIQFSIDYMALYVRRQNCSKTSLESQIRHL
jgi:hypothetical protein